MAQCLTHTVVIAVSCRHRKLHSITNQHLALFRACCYYTRNLVNAHTLKQHTSCCNVRNSANSLDWTSNVNEHALYGTSLSHQGIVANVAHDETTYGV
eukprot:5662-Heterococcus_DN1.PRE.7